MSPAPILYALSNGQQHGALVGPAFPIYRLKSASAPSGANPASIHVANGIDGPDCAACHAAHTAASAYLLNAPAPQTTLCYACHAGTGSDFNVKTQFGGLPTNNASTDTWYSHPVSDASAALHANGTDNEFGGVANRHSVCADCHNPHDATATRPQQATTGWTASGATRAASGVAVTNGSAGQAPTYTFVSRASAGGSLTYEYQLCLKCHSGFTVLPTRSAAHPSWWALDAGVEFNPSNASYHPVEATGKNITSQMAASLAGTSPFKAWTLAIDSTVRCTQCHGDPSTVNQTATATPLQPAADALEASHGSPNRGLLTAPYRDRDLKPAGEAYNAADFALCYLCHAERPFVDPNINPSAPDTAFDLHGMHLQALSSQPGAGTSIDTSGAGEGLATCAECHFRIHSTAIAYQIGDLAPIARATGAAGLVNFAPNVVAAAPGLLPTWNAPGANGTGSCALTCHGHTHVASSSTYTTAPGTGFTASPTSGSAGSTGLAVQFTDATLYVNSASATWLWDFGDGVTSTVRSPLHAYAIAGTYTVSLTVTRTTDGLATTMTRAGFITVSP